MDNDSNQKKEKEKARQLRKSQWWKQKVQNTCCYYCGCELTAKTVTMDHVVPISQGGRSTKGNIVPACKDCNNKKKDMNTIEWQEYLNRLAES